jgi:hypothetical protein
MTEPEDKAPETEETEIEESALPEVVAHSEDEEEAACITNHAVSFN